MGVGVAQTALASPAALEAVPQTAAASSTPYSKRRGLWQVGEAVWWKKDGWYGGSGPWGGSHWMARLVAEDGRAVPGWGCIVELLGWPARLAGRVGWWGGRRLLSLQQWIPHGLQEPAQTDEEARRGACGRGADR